MKKDNTSKDFTTEEKQVRRADAMHARIQDAFASRGLHQQTRDAFAFESSRPRLSKKILARNREERRGKEKISREGR